MGKKNDAKSELGKFIAVIGTVLGVAAGSVFFLNQFVFDSRQATAEKRLAPPKIAQDAGTEGTTNLGEMSQTESSEPKPPVEQTHQVAAPEPFYASLQLGEYVAVLNQDGTEKILTFDLTKEEVKALLGKPASESYVDGETRSLVYSYGPFSIFFDDNDPYISYMTYEGTKEILQKQWLSSLAKTLDSGNVDFYESPSGYTTVKVDDFPDTDHVIVYLIKNDPQSQDDHVPSAEQAQVAQAPAPEPQSANPSTEERMNANGEYLLSPGEEIVIENVQVTNDSRVHTAAYTIDVNNHFAYNSPNMVKVITDPEKELELMPGETATVQIKVKASKNAPKGSYRFIVSLKQGWSTRPLKDFTVEVK